MESGESCYRLFLEGDKAAFAQLVETYRPGLIRFVNAYVHNVHTAEDIAIDCFASLLVHPRRYRFSVPFKSYLYMLGRSRAVDWLRRQRRAQTVPPEEAEAELVSLDTPQQAAEDAERSRALYAAMESLPEDMRRAVLLFYFENMPYKQIAAVLRKSPKQIDNLLTRARGLMRAALQEGGFAP